MERDRGKFKKGQSGNPFGKPKTDPLVKAFRETTYRDFINHLQKYGSFSVEEIKTEIERPDATMFELMFANIVSGAAKGDKDARNVLLDRLWGKVKEVHEVRNFDRELAEVSKERLIEFLKDTE